MFIFVPFSNALSMVKRPLISSIRSCMFFNPIPVFFDATSNPIPLSEIVKKTVFLISLKFKEITVAWACCLEFCILSLITKNNVL